MQDWSSYVLSDFLLFSPRVYERMYVLLNKDLWPAQIVFLLAGLAILITVLRRHPLGMKMSLAALAFAWMFVAIVFFQGRYGQINWLGGYLAPIAIVQGICLLAIALLARVNNGLARQYHSSANVAANMLLFLGLLAYPLLAPAFGRSIAGAQVAFSMPDPTAVATLGMAAMLQSRVRWLVMLVPAAWCALTGLTLWTLGRSDFFIAPLAASAAIVVAALPRQQSR